MNRAQRRLKEKEARRRNKGVYIGMDPAHPNMDNAVEWTALCKYERPKQEPEEKKVPGVNCKPFDPVFESRVNNNLWHDRSELDEFINVIKAQSDENSETNDWCWAYNHSCKYVDVRIDMRDGGFIVCDKDGHRIDMAQLKWQYKSLRDEK